MYVDYIEEDNIFSISTIQTYPPNWGLDRIDQQKLPLTNSYSYEYTGKDVNVYVFDTGINIYHSEFGSRAKMGMNFVDDGYDSLDCNGHGTHVSGIIAGTTYGVAKNANLISIRILDSEGNGFTSNILAGIEWLSKNVVKPALVNISAGGPLSSSLNTAITNSILSGIPYVLAAGNDNLDACDYSPSIIDLAIKVGASTLTDSKSTYSNFGKCVTLFAPGDNILSSWNTSKIATKVLSGTSMATPFVSGAVALLIQSDNTLNPAEIKNKIVLGAVPNVLSNIGTESPNLLLNTQFLLSGQQPPQPTPNILEFKGTLTGPGKSILLPTTAGYVSLGSGLHIGNLTGPVTSDFDLYLYNWSGTSWTVVSKSITQTSKESISYNGLPGKYVWLIYDYSGSGDYDLIINAPK